MAFNVTTLNKDISFDPAKRALTLLHRGLDFARAGEVFAGRTFTKPDDRKDYGEERFTTVGFLDGRFVVVVWTPRGAACRIISMRHGHDKEFREWRSQLD